VAAPVKMVGLSLLIALSFLWEKHKK